MKKFMLVIFLLASSVILQGQQRPAPGADAAESSLHAPGSTTASEITPAPKQSLHMGLIPQATVNPDSLEHIHFVQCFCLQCKSEPVYYACATIRGLYGVVWGVVGCTCFVGESIRLGHSCDPYEDLCKYCSSPQVVLPADICCLPPRITGETACLDYDCFYGKPLKELVWYYPYDAARIARQEIARNSSENYASIA